MPLKKGHKNRLLIFEKQQVIKNKKGIKRTHRSNY